MKILSFILLGGLVLGSLLVSGCSASVNNRITFNNSSDTELNINFRGGVINVAAGKTSVISEIPKGSYDYATTFSSPSGVTNAATTGDVNGQVDIKAGTKVLIYYTSTLKNGVYTLTATKTSSDDLNQTSITGF